MENSDFPCCCRHAHFNCFLELSIPFKENKHPGLLRHCWVSEGCVMVCFSASLESHFMPELVGFRGVCPHRCRGHPVFCGAAVVHNPPEAHGKGPVPYPPCTGAFQLCFSLARPTVLHFVHLCWAGLNTAGMFAVEEEVAVHLSAGDARLWWNRAGAKNTLLCPTSFINQFDYFTLSSFANQT